MNQRHYPTDRLICVRARTIYAFDALVCSGLLESSEVQSHYNEANNHTAFKEKFRQTTEVLNQSGKLTSFGSKILNDCVGLVEGCPSSI